MRNESRYYTITDFERDPSHSEYTDKRIRYCYLGNEVCPETGRKHWQGWIYFTNPMSPTAARKCFPRRHMEIMQGTIDHNDLYCSKEG